MSFETIITDVKDAVGTLTLNRPEALNALNRCMMGEVHTVINAWDQDPAIRTIVIRGSEKAFAAGADIKEMLPMEYLDALHDNFLNDWTCIANCATPTIAAVSGYALGGGCEIAMMCDFILAASNAQFGQPEIRIGILPGLGGTQRLTRLIGKAKAMEMCLTGRLMDADEAERSGLVARVLATDDLFEEAHKSAVRIASYSAPAVQLARESVNAALETSLTQGLNIERHAFYSLFGTHDQKEGMQAFIEKRDPGFSH